MACCRGVMPASVQRFLLLILFTSLLIFSFHGISPGAEVPPRQALLRDVVIAVKTTGKYHATRALDLIDTWFQLAPRQIYLVTDIEDRQLNASCGYHAVLSTCSQQHTREGLCCKMNAELELFIAHKPRWSCHFDDDNYVNIAALARLVNSLDASQDWYLGKPSTTGPITLQLHNDKVGVRGNDHQPQAAATQRNTTTFWFATGGAGFCVSRSLLVKMASYVRNGGFELLGEYLRLPDDVTLGYLIEHLLGVRLTKVDGFHSHLERLHELDRHQLHEQISLSASTTGSGWNVVDVPQTFAIAKDPQR